MKIIPALIAALLFLNTPAFSQDTFQKSTTGANTSERGVIFQNKTDSQAKLVWVDFEGKEVAFTQIAAGAKVEASSQCGHLWRIKQNGHTLKNFRVTDSPQQAFVIKPSSAGGKPPTLKNPKTVPVLKQATSGKRPPPAAVSNKSAPPPPPMAKKPVGVPPKIKASGTTTQPPRSKGPMLPGKLPVPDQRTSWRDVEQSTFQKQPDGSWMLSAKGELAATFGQYQRFTEKARTQFAVQLVGANGQAVDLYDGIMVLMDPKTKRLMSGLPGEWTHQTAQVPLNMQFWKGAKDGTTVTRQSDGRWLYFKPGSPPHAVEAVVKENRMIIFEDPVKGTSFILCRGIALIHDPAMGSYHPMTTGDWVQTSKQ